MHKKKILRLTTNPNATLQAKLRALTLYSESGQWLQDYECDERGEFPHDLKRGILSQDALYNLLSDIRQYCTALEK